MDGRGRKVSYGWVAIGVALIALSSFLIASFAESIPWLDRRPLRDRYRVREVLRTDLIPVLNAPGRLESASAP